MSKNQDLIFELNGIQIFRIAYSPESYIFIVKKKGSKEYFPYEQKEKELTFSTRKILIESAIEFNYA